VAESAPRKNDYQDIVYFSQPKPTKMRRRARRSGSKTLETYEKLGIPLRERERLAGVAVDAILIP